MNNNQRAASSIQIMVELGCEYGLTPAECLRNTGLGIEELNQGDLLVSAEQELQVIDNLVTELPDIADLGIQAGLRYRLTTFGIWGFAMISSPDLKSAIEVGLKYLDLSFVLADFNFYQQQKSDSDTGMGWLEFDTAAFPERLQPFLVGRHLAVAQRLMQEIYGEHIPGHVAIDVALPTLPLARLLTDANLPGSTVSALKSLNFNCKKNRIGIELDRLSQPLPQADPATAAFCLQQCEQILNQRQPYTGIAAKIRQRLLSQAAQSFTLEQLAEQFHISPRTLRRRLADEGTSLRQLQDDVRQTLAIELLTVAQLSVEAVSERLGYGEPASFIRAFNRWTGQTPGQYRLRHKNSLKK